MSWTTIPAAAWKKNRDRMARRARQNMHMQRKPENGETDSKLRYDYIVTAAEVTALVERIMNDTEQLIAHYRMGQR